jgi:dipeptidase E
MSGHIVAIGGGDLAETEPLLRFVLSLSRRDRPRVCFIPTASGDAEGYIARFYRAFAQLDCVPSDLTLFERSVDDLAAFVAEQDVFYVGGGNTANLLVVWRRHGLDQLMRGAHERGAVLSGTSAGIAGGFPAGYAADNQAAIHFEGGRLVEAISSTPEAHAYRVELECGSVVERELATSCVA